MKLDKLPGWIVDNDTSVRAEVAPFVGSSIAERWAATRKCSRAAAAMLRFHSDPQGARAYRDPLPASSAELLETLRKAYRAAGQ